MSAPQSPIRLLIVANPAMVSDAFQLLLSAQEGLATVAPAATCSAALSAVTTLRPDVILLDLQLPDVDGVTTASMITTAAPATTVILMIEFYEEAIVAA